MDGMLVSGREVRPSWSGAGNPRVVPVPPVPKDQHGAHSAVEALRNLRAGRTRITVAHRRSTVRDADTLIVPQGGRIVETGPHHQLAAAPRAAPAGNAAE
jgi:ABC-type protease/lipase transport system fused ATPase/permease subunit